MVAPIVFTIAQIAGRAAPVVAAFARGGMVRVQQQLTKQAAARARTKAAQEAAGRAKTSIPKLEKRLAELNRRESVLTKRVQEATPKGGKVLPMSPGRGDITQFAVRAERAMRPVRLRQRVQEANARVRQAIKKQAADKAAAGARQAETALTAKVTRQAASLNRLVTRARMSIVPRGK